MGELETLVRKRAEKVERFLETIDNHFFEVLKDYQKDLKIWRYANDQNEVFTVIENDSKTCVYAGNRENTALFIASVFKLK